MSAAYTAATPSAGRSRFAKKTGNPPGLGPVEKKRPTEACEVILRVLLDAFHPLEPRVEPILVRDTCEFFRRNRECTKLTQEEVAEKAMVLQRVTVVIPDQVRRVYP